MSYNNDLRFKGIQTSYRDPLLFSLSRVTRGRLHNTDRLAETKPCV